MLHPLGYLVAFGYVQVKELFASFRNQLRKEYHTKTLRLTIHTSLFAELDPFKIRFSSLSTIARTRTLYSSTTTVISISSGLWHCSKYYLCCQLGLSASLETFCIGNVSSVDHSPVVASPNHGACAWQCCLSSPQQQRGVLSGCRGQSSRNEMQLVSKVRKSSE